MFKSSRCTAAAPDRHLEESLSNVVIFERISSWHSPRCGRFLPVGRWRLGWCVRSCRRGPYRHPLSTRGPFSSLNLTRRCDNRTPSRILEFTCVSFLPSVAICKLAQILSPHDDPTRIDETVLAPFDGRVLKSSGRAYRVFMVDGDLTSTYLLSGPVEHVRLTIIQPVVMTTDLIICKRTDPRTLVWRDRPRSATRFQSTMRWLPRRMV